MLDLQSLDFDGWIDGGVTHVFDTMLSMRVTASDRPAAFSVDGDWMVASVRIAGCVLAVLNLWVRRDFAREVAVGLMGIDPADPESKEDVRDVIGEICNMIGGSLKSRLCDAGCACEMSTPAVLEPNPFRFEVNRWELKGHWGFRNCRHSVLVELFARSARTPAIERSGVVSGRDGRKAAGPKTGETANQHCRRTVSWT
jgi:chemotaxis protein CheX